MGFHMNFPIRLPVLDFLGDRKTTLGLLMGPKDTHGRHNLISHGVPTGPTILPVGVPMGPLSTYDNFHGRYYMRRGV